MAQKDTTRADAVPTGTDQKLDPEVLPRAKRRRFAAQYKLDILKEVAACVDSKEVGALLRREGLYSSHLAQWRKERDKGALAALGRKRGRKPKMIDPVAVELGKARRENERLRHRLEQAELIIEIQKKISALLGIPLNTPEIEGAD